jgi:hypothetical protein
MENTYAVTMDFNDGNSNDPKFLYRIRSEDKHSRRIV